MEEKRFNIEKSYVISHGFFIQDNGKKYTFPTHKGDKTGLYAYCKALNDLSNKKDDLLKENKLLKKEISKLKKEGV